MTQEEAYAKWETAIGRRKEVADLETITKINLDSVLAGEIRDMKSAGESVTLIEKLVKGKDTVKTATKEYLDAETRRKALDAYLDFIASRVVDLRKDAEDLRGITR